jgi:hypothetical protein
MFEMEREHDSGPEATSFDQSINIFFKILLHTSPLQGGKYQNAPLIHPTASFKYIT